MAFDKKAVNKTLTDHWYLYWSGQQIIINNISFGLNRLLNYLNSPAPDETDVLMVIPGNHAKKLLRLFKILKRMNIRYLVISHNLTLLERCVLIFNQIPVLREREISSKTKPKHKYHSVKNAHKIINDFNPKMLITTTDPDKKILPFVQAAKEENVKTVTIQHGTYSNPKGADFISDYAFIWGPYYKSWFVNRLGKNKRSLITTGSPFFDDLKFNSATKLNKSKGRYKILILLTIYTSMKKRFASELADLVKGLSMLGRNEILMRPHPWQKLDKNLFTFTSKSTVKEAISRSLKFYLKKSDIVITLDTTAGFDALIDGKALIYWNFNQAESLPFEKAGIPSANTPKTVIAAVKDTINGKLKIDDEKRRLLAKDVFYKLDGKSSFRIANAIASLLKKRF